MVAGFEKFKEHGRTTNMHLRIVHANMDCHA